MPKREIFEAYMGGWFRDWNFCKGWLCRLRQRISLLAVLRIRDVNTGSRIQDQKDPTSRIQGKKHPRSRILVRIKEFKYFLPKNLFLSCRKNNVRCSSRIRIRFFPIPDPGYRGKKSTGSATLVVRYAHFAQPSLKRIFWLMLSNEHALRKR